MKENVLVCKLHWLFFVKHSIVGDVLKFQFLLMSSVVSYLWSVRSKFSISTTVWSFLFLLFRKQDLSPPPPPQTSEMGGERGGMSTSDLLLSTLLLHGAGDGGTTAQRHGNLHPSASQGTILRTVYMQPDDVEEPPPGMRPPPRPAPPTLKKASLMSDELKRIDVLAEEVSWKLFDLTNYKWLKM